MCLIFAFLMIVTGLTGSSVFLNQQKTYQDAIANATPSTKAILSVLDTEQLEADLANNQIDYTRIGNTTYVLNYDSSDSAQTAELMTMQLNLRTLLTKRQQVMKMGMALQLPEQF